MRVLHIEIGVRILVYILSWLEHDLGHHADLKMPNDGSPDGSAEFWNSIMSDANLQIQVKEALRQTTMFVT